VCKPLAEVKIKHFLSKKTGCIHGDIEDNEKDEGEENENSPMYLELPWSLNFLVYD